MIARLCEPEHLLIIILVLLVAMLVVGSGKGIGTVLGGLIRKFTGKGDVIVNVGEQGVQGVQGVQGAGLTLDDLKTELTKRPHCTDHSLIKERQDGVMIKIEFLVEECKSIWGEIKDINQRQIVLREKLPEQYINKGDLAGIKERLKSIDDKLDRYIELSIKK
jgi:hypothetical protein